MMQTLKKCGIWLCVGLSLVIYTLSLVRFEPWYEFFLAISWRGYLIRTGLTLTAGGVLVFLSRRLRDQEYGLPFVLASAAAVLSALGAYGLYDHSWKWITQQLLLSVWPLGLLVWARLWKSKYEMKCPAAPYYLGVGAACWVVLELLAPTQWLRWDLLTLIYMVVTAFWVWRSYYINIYQVVRRYGDKLLTKRGRLALRVQPWLPLVGAAALILCFHPRARDILTSLLRPLGAWRGGIGQVNWLSHRLHFMAQGWQGDFALVDAALIRDLPMSAPLVWISLRLSPAAAAALVAAQFWMLHLLYSLERNTGWRPLSLSCVLLSCLTVQTFLGFAGEVMLNTSSSLGMPMLRSPGSALLLPLCIAADPGGSGVLEQLVEGAEKWVKDKLAARGWIKNELELPEDWQLYCPPWDGEMTLQTVGWSDMVRYSAASYGAMRLQWISQETEEDGSTRRTRQPQEQTRRYVGFPIQAAGKTYHSLDQLTRVDKGHCRLYRDIHGRLVFRMVKPFPCFDEFDAMCETRMYRWFFLREGEKLTRIYTADDSEEIYVTEDVESLECCAWEHMLQWGYFSRELH